MKLKLFTVISGTIILALVILNYFFPLAHLPRAFGFALEMARHESIRQSTIFRDPEFREYELFDRICRGGGLPDPDTDQLTLRGRLTSNSNIYLEVSLPVHFNYPKTKVVSLNSNKLAMTIYKVISVQLVSHWSGEDSRNRTLRYLTNRNGYVQRVEVEEIASFSGISNLELLAENDGDITALGIESPE